MAKSKANATTRYGNGAGYGGPARGRRDIPTIQTAPAFQPGQSGNPSGLAGEWRKRKEELSAKAMQVWIEVIEKPSATDTNKIVAAEKIMNRVDGLPVARVVTPDSAVHWFIEGVVEAESMEQWQQTAQLAIAKPQGSGDD